MKTIRIAAACFVNTAQELLVVRKQDAAAWMLPGGKLDAHESPTQALVREVREELKVLLQEDALVHLGSFAALAANEVHTAVQADAYLAKLPQNQQPRISAEIVEMRWLPLDEPLPESLTQLLKQHIIPALKAAQSGQGTLPC